MILLRNGLLLISMMYGKIMVMLPSVKMNRRHSRRTVDCNQMQRTLPFTGIVSSVGSHCCFFLCGFLLRRSWPLSRAQVLPIPLTLIAFGWMELAAKARQLLECEKTTVAFVCAFALLKVHGSKRPCILRVVIRLAPTPYKL